jgi:hypothetical protein
MVQLDFFRRRRLKLAWFSVLLSNPIRKKFLLISSVFRTLPNVVLISPRPLNERWHGERNSGETGSGNPCP